MKKVILYVASVFIIAAVAAAPGTKLLQRFNETFPNAKNVKWRDDAAGYFVSFTQSGNFNKVFYNTAGNCVYSIKYTDGTALPVNITMALNKNLGESKIIGVTEVTTQNNLVYNIKLSKDEKLYCLDLLADGSIAKQEVFDDASSAVAVQ
jgi:hypothetical protein